MAEGLLRRDAHKTARLPSMSRADIEDLYFSRSYIESEAVRRMAARREVPDEARRTLAEIEAVGEASSTEIVEPDVRFHESIVDTVGSERISRLYRALMGEMRLCMRRSSTGSKPGTRTVPPRRCGIISTAPGTAWRLFWSATRLPEIAEEVPWIEELARDR
ncbi:FCD domain-containing protein [Lentzea kentuckyensis]|uniref:FCD domain-containing protein n=1 Tax=Lentzea kentuckyensis TaxID=360086 RepID=UPI000A3AF456|nr:FCD domain-containing protein [Lentzea kentuckyensis]